MLIKKYIIGIIAVIILLFIVKSCEKEPEVVTKTEIKYIKVTDTVTKTIISEPKTVYINRFKTLKGKDSIVYIEKETKTTIKANQFTTELLSNNAKADLKITTTGELLDVTGVISYENKETTTTITKKKNKSGLFIYGSAPVNDNFVNIEVGLLYQIKNKVLIMGGVQYNQFTQSPDIKIGVGFKL